MAHTERAKARLWEEQYVDYGWEVPDACVTMLLGLVFCVIQPLMTPIALVYFLVNSCLYKYQLIYVHKPQFESGGLVSFLPSRDMLYSVMYCWPVNPQCHMKGLPYLVGVLFPVVLGLLRSSASIFCHVMDSVAIWSALYGCCSQP